MISVVIPNYNSEKLLAKNLPKLLDLLKKTKLNFEIIVVDDASTDNSLSYLRNLSHLRILKNSKNLGFASTVDRGIRAARGEIVFTLKTDCLPESPDYFRLMKDAIASLQHDGKKVFSVTAGLKTIENGKEEIRGAGEIYFEKGFFLHRRSWSNWSNLTNLTNFFTDWPDGSASAFNKEIYLKLGGFDKIYDPFYWEDVDLGFRAQKAGYLCVFEPKAILIHEHEEGAINRHYSPEQVKEISLRNQFIFTWKNGNATQLIAHWLLLIFYFRDRSFLKAFFLAIVNFPLAFFR